VKTLRTHFRKYLDGPMVRPLALTAPVLVLVVALPLLRPLRHPESMSDDELLRLRSVQALVEHGSLALDKSMGKFPGTIILQHGTYSMQPPMMAVLLSAPAWLMTKMGFSFEENGVLFAYILTVLGVTLPVAGAAGLIYRMGRLFELRRPWRTLLACCVVAGSGLLTYSVVLNQYAPAAALVLASGACLIHVAAMNRADRRAGWFALAGACAALATALDPFAAVMLVLFMFVIPAMRFSIARRVVGVLLYVIGATPVLAVHTAWNNPITGDAIPASVRWFFHSQPTFPPVTFVRDDLDEEQSTSLWDTLGSHLSWFVQALVGRHGLLSHFPVMIMGMFGIGAVMHRHWPGSTKLLAAASGAGALIILIIYRYGRADWSSAMFATQWFVVFSPVLLFWSGAWLRRGHTMRSWILAGVATGFSVVVGLIGATNPTPRYGYDRYTAVQALRMLLHPSPATRGAPLAGKD
jgi:hypothetical protein